MVSRRDPKPGRGSPQIRRTVPVGGVKPVRILFDHGVPVPLRKKLSGHQISTAHEMGWNQVSNGELISKAEGSFDVFISTDQNLKHQQNLKNRKIAILVLPTTSWRKIETNSHLIQQTLDSLKPNIYEEIKF